MRKTRSSRCISSRMAAPRASLYVITGICVTRWLMKCGEEWGVWSDRVQGGLCSHSPPPTPHPSRRSVSVHVLVERFHRQLGARFGEVPRVLHDRLDLLVQLLELFVRELSRVLHVRAQKGDRIALHVLLELR